MLRCVWRNGRSLLMLPLQGYKRFIARQMEEAEAAKKASKKRQITPEPGFVARVEETPSTATGPRTCFLNVCQHRAVCSLRAPAGCIT